MWRAHGAACRARTQALVTSDVFHLPLMECPACHRGGFALEDGALACEQCGHRYGTANGIGLFLEAVDDYVENYEQICADDLLEPKTPSAVKEIFADLIGARAGGTICDLGCGDGYVLRRAVGERRIAVDIARPYLETLPASIMRILSWVEDVPLKAGAIDTLICTDVLEHVRDAGALAREIERLVRPGGRLLLVVPFEQDLGVYDLPEYKAKYAKYKYVHLRSIGDATVAGLFANFELGATHLITEGMKFMEFKPYPIKFYELIARPAAA